MEVKLFMVDVSGVHSVHLFFCGCQHAPEHCIQLLQHCWFPASMKWPKTAITFNFLNTYHLLNLQFKMVLYNFWLSIHHKTDNPGIVDIKVRSTTISC